MENCKAGQIRLSLQSMESTLWYRIVKPTLSKKKNKNKKDNKLFLLFCVARSVLLGDP